jgi:predicted O-methyltransferase YrrM
MDLINRGYIDEYLTGLAHYPETPVMKEMRETAKKLELPVLRPAAAAFLNVLVQLRKPSSILEIGTSIGYSGLVMLNAMGPAGHLTTAEIDEDILQTARENFDRHGVSERVTLIGGDGGDVLHYMEDTFDMIFLDGPKAQYLLYLPDCIRLLSPGGLLVCDDVLFYGMVAKDELVLRRKITIVKRMRKFLNAISNHPQLDTTIVPIGDGISVSIKKEVSTNEST